MTKFGGLSAASVTFGKWLLPRTVFGVFVSRCFIRVILDFVPVGTDSAFEFMLRAVNGHIGWSTKIIWRIL